MASAERIAGATRAADASQAAYFRRVLADEREQVGSDLDAELTDVEHGGRPDYNSGADPYLRITGWLPH